MLGGGVHTYLCAVITEAKCVLCGLGSHATEAVRRTPDKDAFDIVMPIHRFLSCILL